MTHHNLIFDYLTADSGFFLHYERKIADFNSRYQQVKLVESETFGRVLLLNGKIQSTQVDEFIYHEALVHPAMLSHPDPRSVYIAGGGEGATLREVLRHDTVQEAVMVDLDEEVVRICKEYLPSWHQGAFDDSRTRLLFGDARTVLEKEERTYDVIICDLSEPVDDGPSYMLFTQEFYRLCQRRLNPGGVLVTQSGCPSFVYSESFHSVTTTLESVFRNTSPYLAFIPSFASDWGFALAGDSPILPRIDSEVVSRRLSDMVSELRYLDPQFIPSMFAIPKHLQGNKETVGRIIRDGEPLIVI
ncbi:MAG: polyamine aminopropyltransferase [bacterium]